ncbi:1773_t:CDS:2, partial [Funneliformis caledonium]
YISKELEFDLQASECGYTRQLNSFIPSENFLKKRDIKELEINTQVNSDNLISKPLNIDFAGCGY